MTHLWDEDKTKCLRDGCAVVVGHTERISNAPMHRGQNRMVSVARYSVDGGSTWSEKKPQCRGKSMPRVMP